MKAVIFDLDGTLADTLSGITHFVNRTTAAYGLSSLSQERVKSFVGNGARVLLERSFAHLGEELPEGALDYYNSLYDNHSDHDLREYKGISPLLAALKEKGLKLAVLSNKPHTATVPVCRFLFGDKIDFVLGQKEDVPRKPDITGVRLVWQALEVTAEDCLYVGDSEVDMLTGKKAGMLTVGVSWGFREECALWENGADHVINKPEELLCLLK